MKTGKLPEAVLLRSVIRQVKHRRDDVLAGPAVGIDCAAIAPGDGEVIVLSTDEEINDKYLDDIKDYVNTSYTLVYDEREKCSSIVPGYFGGELI